MAKLKNLIFLLILFGFALTSGCGIEQTKSPNGEDNEAEKVSSDIIELKSEDEFNTILSSHKIVLVDFYADWCPPCKVLKPTINKIAKTYFGNVKVLAVNIDQFGKIASTFNIRSIPTVNIFNSNKLEASLVGVRSMSDYTHILDQLITKKL